MLIKLNNITKSYGSKAEGNFRKVLDDLSLEIQEGESVAILGPSGSGKTTLLNIIGTMDHPDSGEYSFQNKNMADATEKELDRFRNTQIGFVFQFHHLLPQCTLIENILIPTLPFAKKERTEKQNRAEELLQQVGILERKDQKPGHLSGGECQRAAVVRALINNPKLLLADEPTGALDGENVTKLADLLLEINKNDGITLVIVTHSLELASKMEKIYEIKDGKLHHRTTR